MTVRLPVSILQNRWNDAQRVDRGDMNTEQEHNNSSLAAVVHNHLGSGVVPSSIIQTVLFDSESLTSEQASILASGDFDGIGHQIHTQPTDTNLGNQLEVELTGSTVFGRLSVKVLIVGLDFEGVPQYDRFTFHKNEKQISKKHFTRILGVFFNDFKGNNNCSRNNGGRIVIRETASFQLSRDAIMVSQDIEPNLFFRDFKVSNPAITLYNTLQAGIGSEYSVDALNINTTVKINRTLVANDITSKIAQKFKATTNNIQKITLLLGVGRNDSAPVADRFDWSGDIVISIYELQTTVDCPTDIVPELAIEFDPKPEPLVQLSFSQAELYDLGYILTDVLQPIDFIFSDTQIGSTTNPLIVPDRFYTISINRSGAANTGLIFTGVGNNRTEDARLSLFSGTWVDVPEEDLWFQVWTDAAKVADGLAYDTGNGIQIDKTEINDLGAEVDFAFDAMSFAESGENILNTAVIQAIQEESVREQDERNGNPVFSRKRFEPQFSFVNTTNLATLEETTEPLIIGCAQDINPKQNELIEGIQLYPGLANDDTFTIINPDPDLLSNNLLGSKLIPNTGCNNKDYRIFKVIYCTDGYGDVNGDGAIDDADIVLAAQLIGEDLSSSSTQQKIIDGYFTTLQVLRADVDGDGVVSANDVTLITNFVTREINGFPVGESFTHLDIVVQQSIGRYDGYFDCGDGYVRLDGYFGNNIVSSDDLDPLELLYDGYLSAVSIDGEDTTFTTVPFIGTEFQIVPQPFWQDYLIVFSSEARQMPAAFTLSGAISEPECSAALTFECSDRSDIVPQCDARRNDIMFPDNIILRRGQILSQDGTPHKIDFEIGQVVLQLPELPLDESVINIFEKFVYDNDNGFTKAGFPAMRFSDCSTVKSDALAKNQIRFDVAIQSISNSLDGYDSDGYGVVVNEGIHAYIDHTNGLLYLSVKDMEADEILQTKVSKIQITAYLKKGGFINTPLIIDTDQIEGLISS